MNTELGSKRLGLLHQLLPRAMRFAMMARPANPFVDTLIKDARAAAATKDFAVEYSCAPDTALLRKGLPGEAGLKNLLELSCSATTQLSK